MNLYESLPSWLMQVAAIICVVLFAVTHDWPWLCLSAVCLALAVLTL